MSSETSVLDNLFRRRVPQIVGMYVAAMWLIIELGDWVTSRFNLPPSLTSYVFVAMLALLPALIMFAYNHGAPGRDRWTGIEKLFIPTNLILAAGLLYFVSPLLHVEAVEQIKLQDETGNTVTYERAKSGFHKDVMGFFWQNQSNDEALDWLSYGLPLMVKHDMNRASPVLTLRTPFGSFLARRELREKGYASYLDEEFGLQVEIARIQNSHSFMVGAFNETASGKTIETKLFDSQSGELIGEYTASGSDWLTLVDEISAAMLDYLDIRLTEKQRDDPISQHFSASIEAIEHYMTGEVAVELHNDFSLGVAEMEKAVAIDSGFAEADADLAVLYFLNGDAQKANAVVPRALANSHRMSKATEFRLKANHYSFAGNYRNAERVLEVWAEIQPQSTEAFSSLARVAQLRGGESGLVKAREAYTTLLELKPHDYSINRQLASVEQQRGDYQTAIAFMDRFLEHEKDNAEAVVQLAGLYQAKGELQQAEDILHRAAILSNNPLESNLGLARLQARRGKYHEAKQLVQQQLHDNMSPQERMQVLNLQMELALATGQIRNAIDYFQGANEAAKAFMAPVVRLLSVENPMISSYVLLGQFEKALAEYQRMESQLQPPVNAYVYFGYTHLYSEMGDEDKFREWAAKTYAIKDSLPELFGTFVEFDQARVAIYDEEYEKAVAILEEAEEHLQKSLLSFMQDSLVSSQIHTLLAHLYTKAQQPQRALDYLEGVLKVYPALAEAHLVRAQSHFDLGNKEAAKTALDITLDIWKNADPDYVRYVTAQTLAESL